MPAVIDLLFSDLNSALPTIATLITVVVGAVTLFLHFRNVRGEHEARLHVRRITTTTDADLVEMEELQAEEFPSEDEADNTGRIRLYLQRSAKGPGDPSSTTPHMLVFVLKLKRRVCGYLTAQYFPHSETVFLWYLAVSKRRVPVPTVFQTGAQQLLAEMVNAADATGVRWRHAITEVASDGVNFRGPRARMQHFNNAAEKLAKEANRFDIGVAKLSLKYRQPTLRPQLVGEVSDEELHKHEENAWLLYVSRDGKSSTMKRETARELLRTIVVNSYGWAFADFVNYKPYAEALLLEYFASLPDQVEMTSDSRRAADDHPVTGQPA